MQIFLASDHAGFYLKEIIKKDLLNRGFQIEDFGANSYDELDDFPDFIKPCVAKYLAKTNGDPKKGFAIIFGGSGTGEAIAANRNRGARAVVLNHENLEIIKLGRAHNNANIISVGARFVDEKICLEAIKIFTTTQFEGGKYAKRIMKTDMIE